MEKFGPEAGTTIGLKNQRKGGKGVGRGKKKVR